MTHCVADLRVTASGTTWCRSLDDQVRVLSSAVTSNTNKVRKPVPSMTQAHWQAGFRDLSKYWSRLTRTSRVICVMPGQPRVHEKIQRIMAIRASAYLFEKCLHVFI